MPNYIKDLRRVLGHRPLMQCGANVLIMDDPDRILLQRRTDNDLWGIPGGAVELGEKVEDAARREILEETGLKLIDLELFGVFSGEDQYFRYPNGDEVYNITIVYVSRKFTGSFRIDGVETKDLRFFGYNTLPTNIVPPDWPILNEFFRYTE